MNFYLKSLSHYLGKNGVRINIVAPGNIMFKGSTWEKKVSKNKKQVKKLIKETVPLNKFGSTDDITDVISFLVSDNSAYINGSVISVDGGLTV